MNFPPSCFVTHYAPCVSNSSIIIGTFHFLSAPPLWKAFFVLSSWTLSESVIFASIEGVGIAILLIIDPRNHGLSHCLYSIQKQGCRNPYSLKWGCWNLPFIHMVVVGVPPFLILVHFFKISPNFVYDLFRPRHVVSTPFECFDFILMM